jgi:GT2 family glycosyltransferase
MKNVFRGKKAMCFIALPHHNRLFFPIMQALKRRGMEVAYFTASAESAFEITLHDAGLPYVHPLDYADAEVQAQIRTAYGEIRALWQERVLSHPALQCVPLTIQDKNNWSVIESLFSFKRMLEVEKPDVLFGLHELNSWGKTLGYLSHELKIPYITLQEGYYFGSPPFYRFHTDYSTACVVWGEFKKDLLVRAGCSPDKLAPLGNIDLWEAHARATKPESIAAIRKELGVGPQKKIVLFLMCHASYGTIPGERLAAWLEKRGDVTAVFKWHPVTGPDIVARATEQLKTSPHVVNTQTLDTYKLMGASDLCVIVGTSTTGMEALAYGKPLLELRLPDRVFSFAEQGLAEPVAGMAEIPDKIDRLLEQGVPAERLARIEQYLKGLFAYRDNKTTERISDMAGEMLEARTRVRPSTIHGQETDVFDCSIVVPIDGSQLSDVAATLQSISQQSATERYEVLVVDCSTNQEVSDWLRCLDGDVTIVRGEPGSTFSECCNRAAGRARGKHLVFIKPGVVIGPDWLGALLKEPQQYPDAGVIGSRVLDRNGLIRHIGIAFDVNQSPFSIYRMLPGDFAGANKHREFKAVEGPFLVSRELFCRLGGFSTDLENRFEEIDFCLRVRDTGLHVLYTPAATSVLANAAWLPSDEQNRLNCYRFYARWTGFLWQDDDSYLNEDGLTHGELSALYRGLADRIGASAKEPQIAAPAVNPGLAQPNA